MFSNINARNIFVSNSPCAHYGVSRVRIFNFARQSRRENDFLTGEIRGKKKHSVSPYTTMRRFHYVMTRWVPGIVFELQRNYAYVNVHTHTHAHHPPTKKVLINSERRRRTRSHVRTNTYAPEAQNMVCEQLPRS